MVVFLGILVSWHSLLLIICGRQRLVIQSLFFCNRLSRVSTICSLVLKDVNRSCWSKIYFLLCFGVSIRPSCTFQYHCESLDSRLVVCLASCCAGFGSVIKQLMCVVKYKLGFDDDCEAVCGKYLKPFWIGSLVLDKQ